MQKWEYLGMYHKAVRDAHGRKARSEGPTMFCQALT